MDLYDLRLGPNFYEIDPETAYFDSEMIAILWTLDSHMDFMMIEMW